MNWRWKRSSASMTERLKPAVAISIPPPAQAMNSRASIPGRLRPGEAPLPCRRGERNRRRGPSGASVRVQPCDPEQGPPSDIRGLRPDGYEHALAEPPMVKNSEVNPYNVPPTRTRTLKVKNMPVQLVRERRNSRSRSRLMKKRNRSAYDASELIKVRT